MPNDTFERLQWDKDGERLYETGVDRVVLYLKSAGAYPKGVAWNGVTQISERPSGAESNPIYADNDKYLNLRSKEEFGATIEAYTYPDEFAECDGSIDVVPGVRLHQQPRKTFGLSYRSLIGNDEEDTNYGYKLHLVWGCDAAPSEVTRQTMNESIEPGAFSWEISTTPVKIPGYRSCAHLEIDSTKVDAEKLTQFEDMLYGVDSDAEHSVEGSQAYLPLPEDVIAFFRSE
jgi:hypothetical protein